MELSDKIRLIRTTLKKSQSAFATPLGVSGPYISMLEKDHSTPSETLISLLIAVYHVNRGWWDTGDGEMFSHEPLQPYSTLEMDAATDPILRMINERYNDLDDKGKVELAATLFAQLKRKSSV